jgi:hypothetical protein
MDGLQWKQDDYVRAARRLRGQYAHRPAELHNRLRQLVSLPPSSPRPDILPEHEFTRLAATRIQAGVLRYSDRVALLSAAEKMGIGRFDTNLLIALAQHRQQRRMVLVIPRSPSRWRLFALAILIQGTILSTFYWLIR